MFNYNMFYRNINYKLLMFKFKYNKFLSEYKL